MTPLGTKVFVHERTTQRGSHVDHGRTGYILGPSEHHYRHLNFYIPSTCGVRDSDTYVFLPIKYEIPETAATDRMTIALEELTKSDKQY